MSEIIVKLLGRFEVCGDTGDPIAIRTRKARALFAVLARRPGQPQARESLAAMLWPDSAEAQARGSLRQALKLVRRALGDQGSRLVVSEGDAIHLAADVAEVDADRFEHLHDAGTPEALGQAAELYQGEFLEGTNLADGPFADWSTIEQVQLRERAVEVFSRLLDDRLEAGEIERAIEVALKLLALDPLQEHIHRHLMRLYLEQGRRGSAIAQYRICHTTLDRELDVRPEAETERLYQDICRSRPSVDTTASEISARTQPETQQPLQADDRFLGRPAVAVLPFANLGGDRAQTYFSDGLSEDIITALAGWRCFPLIASRSTLAYRDERQDVRDIAKGLDARYVVDGSVRKAGRRMRVTARLIESEGGRQLWTERFDFDLDDILEVQEETAQRIAAIVEPNLESAELRRIVTKRTEDLTAWDHFLQGTACLHRYTPEGNALARSSFEHALLLDAEYGDAFTGIAFGNMRDIRYTDYIDRPTLIAKGMEAARQAIAFDSASSMAHLAFAEAHVWAEDLDVAIPETELAIELNPSNAHARMGLGNRLDLVGRTTEGIAQMERSLQLNPRDPWSFNYMGFLARAHISLGEYETALGWARKAVQIRPDLPDMHFRLAIALAHLDETNEARVALQKCDRLRPGFIESRKTWQPYAETSRNEHFFAGLNRHGLFD